ncbi:hypothetical protein [Thermovibrio ammonificans]
MREFLKRFKYKSKTAVKAVRYGILDLFYASLWVVAALAIPVVVKVIFSLKAGIALNDLKSFIFSSGYFSGLLGTVLMYMVEGVILIFTATIVSGFLKLDFSELLGEGAFFYLMIFVLVFVWFFYKIMGWLFLGQNPFIFHNKDAFVLLIILFLMAFDKSPYKLRKPLSSGKE